jgi:hypothetical protein
MKTLGVGLGNVLLKKKNAENFENKCQNMLCFLFGIFWFAVLNEKKA